MLIAIVVGHPKGWIARFASMAYWLATLPLVSLFALHQTQSKFWPRALVITGLGVLTVNAAVFFGVNTGWDIASSWRIQEQLAQLRDAGRPVPTHIGLHRGFAEHLTKSNLRTVEYPSVKELPCRNPIALGRIHVCSESYDAAAHSAIAQLAAPRTRGTANAVRISN